MLKPDAKSINGTCRIPTIRVGPLLGPSYWINLLPLLQLALLNSNPPV